MSKFPLSTIRHSAAHVLAQAVQVFFKDAKLAIGPAIDTGFYYDFELDRPLTDSDLEKIEVEMKRIINEGQEFKQYDMAKSDAIKLFKDTNQDYKCEIMDDLDVDNVSIYENGPFLDLCRGPHVDKTSQIGAVKLLKVSVHIGAVLKTTNATAYLWHCIFQSQGIKKYLFQLEEAKKRDHRKLGKELQLFSIQEDIGGGLVLWHPNGAAIRTVIEDHWRKEHQKNGYQTVFSLI